MDPWKLQWPISTKWQTSCVFHRWLIGCFFFVGLLMTDKCHKMASKFHVSKWKRRGWSSIFNPSLKGPLQTAKKKSKCHLQVKKVWLPVSFQACPLHTFWVGLFTPAKFPLGKTSWWLNCQIVLHVCLERAPGYGRNDNKRGPATHTADLPRLFGPTKKNLKQILGRIFRRNAPSGQNGTKMSCFKPKWTTRRVFSSFRLSRLFFSWVSSS